MVRPLDQFVNGGWGFSLDDFLHGHHLPSYILHSFLLEVRDMNPFPELARFLKLGGRGASRFIFLSLATITASDWRSVRSLPSHVIVAGLAFSASQLLYNISVLLHQ